jgi:hypothetical protein
MLRPRTEPPLAERALPADEVLQAVEPADVFATPVRFRPLGINLLSGSRDTRFQRSSFLVGSSRPRKQRMGLVGCERAPWQLPAAQVLLQLVWRGRLGGLGHCLGGTGQEELAARAPKTSTPGAVSFPLPTAERHEAATDRSRRTQSALPGGSPNAAWLGGDAANPPVSCCSPQLTAGRAATLRRCRVTNRPSGP